MRKDLSIVHFNSGNFIEICMFLFVIIFHVYWTHFFTEKILFCIRTEIVHYNSPGWVLGQPQQLPSHPILLLFPYINLNDGTVLWSIILLYVRLYSNHLHFLQICWNLAKCSCKLVCTISGVVSREKIRNRGESSRGIFLKEFLVKWTLLYSFTLHFQGSLGHTLVTQKVHSTSWWQPIKNVKKIAYPALITDFGVLLQLRLFSPIINWWSCQLPSAWALPLLGWHRERVHMHKQRCHPSDASFNIANWHAEVRVAQCNVQLF